MPVFISMGLATLLWSLYPLSLAIGLETMGNFEMLVIIYIIAMFGSILMGGYYLHKQKLVKPSIAVIKKMPPRAYYAIIASGITNTLCHGFFILALSMANKAGVSLLYESWPIIALVATPFLMQKAWKEVSFKEFLISLSALLGIAIIILSDENINLFSNNPNIITEDKFNYITLAGYILAFIGGYMCALSVVAKGVISEYFNSFHDDIGSSFISEITTRTISAILVLIAFTASGNEFNFENINWISTFFAGYIVLVMGGALYTYSLLKTDRPTIHIIYYFVPILSVIWLWMAGQSEINTGIFIGGGIILLANIYLIIAGRKASLPED